MSVEESPKTSTASYSFVPPKPKIYYVRESALQSIVADFFTFGTLIGLTTMNYVYWGGHWYFNILIIFCWLSFTLGKARAKIREFNDRGALIDFLIHELEEEDRTIEPVSKPGRVTPNKTKTYRKGL
jgi:hypothetical protein